MRAPTWLALGVTACGLAWDPGAYAAHPKRALAALLGCACVTTALVTARRRSDARRRVSPALLAAGVFVALTTLSLAWGRPAGALDAATFVAGTGVVVLALRMRRAAAVAAARLSSLWLGGATGAVCVASALHGARGFALHAGQGNPNWLGLLLAVTIPLCADTCILHIRRRRLATRDLGLTLAGLVMQVPALYLSHSRVAWVACAVAVALVLAGTLRGWRRRVTQVSVGVALLLCLCTGGVAGAEEHDSFSDDVPAARSLHGRVGIWKIGAAAARGAGPFGTGLGTFERAFHEAQGRALSQLTPNVAARAYENATTAHQEYLQAAIESGPLAALALLATWVLGIAGAVRAKFLGGAGALCACAIASLGDSPLRQPAIVLLVAVVLGTLRGARTKHVANAVVRKLVIVSLLVLSAWSLMQSTRAWLGARAYLASFAADPDSRLRLLGKSARLYPSSGDAQFERALVLLSLGEPRAALADLDTASELMTDPGIFCARGEAHLALDEASAAESDYRAALALGPGSLRARVGLASAQHRQGKEAEAETNAKIAKKLSPGNPQVRELLDAIHESQSDE